MRRRPLFVLGIALAAACAGPAGAQKLASRVARAPDGVVRIEVPSRPGVCGDGGETIGYRHALFARNFRSMGGHWREDRCVPGPLRVSLDVASGAVTRLHVQVGGGWPAADRVTDLGVVSGPEASAYFFTLVPRLETSRRDRSRILLPAVLAEDAQVVEPLLALARNADLSLDLRRDALFWLGQTGEARAHAALHGVIEDGREDVRIRSHAVFALALGEPPASEFAWLRALYGRTGDLKLREAIIHGMSQDADAGGDWLLARALDTRESLHQRKNALFWAGQREETPTAELARVYREADSAELREHAIFVLSQRKDDASIDALMRIAREDTDTQMKGKALFWLAQSDDPRVRKLIADIILR